jgi:hypothetical protein
MRDEAYQIARELCQGRDGEKLVSDWLAQGRSDFQRSDLYYRLSEQLLQRSCEKEAPEQQEKGRIPGKPETKPSRKKPSHRKKGQLRAMPVCPDWWHENEPGVYCHSCVPASIGANCRAAVPLGEPT